MMSILAQTPLQHSEVNFPGGWPIIPFSALVGTIIVGFLVVVVLLIAHYADRYTKGFLTISVLVMLAFIVAVFASLIYNVPTNPITEILVGALSTALGAIVAHWVGLYRAPPEEQNPDGEIHRDDGA